jgi:excisionase family DNA binding protein
MVANVTSVAFVMRSTLGVSDIAEITRTSRMTVLRWIKAGKFGKVRKISRDYQVPYESFKQWWDHRKKVATAQKGKDERG